MFGRAPMWVSISSVSYFCHENASTCKSCIMHASIKGVRPLTLTLWCRVAIIQVNQQQQKAMTSTAFMTSWLILWSDSLEPLHACSMLMRRNHDNTRDHNKRSTSSQQQQHQQWRQRLLPIINQSSRSFRSTGSPWRHPWSEKRTRYWLVNQSVRQGGAGKEVIVSFHDGVESETLTHERPSNVEQQQK